MNKHMILCLTLIPCMGALQATDVGVAAADHADNSLLGSKGYFSGQEEIFPKTIMGGGFKLDSGNALSATVDFTHFASTTDHSYLQQRIKDPANVGIFPKAKAFGILTVSGCLLYVVLNNGRTYWFYNNTKETITTPLTLHAISGTDIGHVFGYTSNSELISQVFASISNTGKIDSSLWPALGYTPPATFDPSLLATAASAVVATHGGGEAGAAAGAGAGRVSPPENEETRRIRELIVTNARLREENARLRTTCSELTTQNNKLSFLLRTHYDKPGMNPEKLDAKIKELLNAIGDTEFTPDHS